MSWIPDAIAYQINLRTLAAREPRNPIEAASEEELGTSPLAYLTRNLDVLRALGVTLLHLAPPYPAGKAFQSGAGMRTAPRDLTGTDPALGSVVEMKAFVRSAHVHGFKVIFDVTPHITSRDHAWVLSKTDHYLRRQDGGVAAEVEGSDSALLDLARTEVRRAVVESLDAWLSLLGLNEDGVIDGIDGFAIDHPFTADSDDAWREIVRDLTSRHLDRTLLFLAAGEGGEHSVRLFDLGFTAAEDAALYGACGQIYGVDDAGQTVTDMTGAIPGDGPAGAIEQILMQGESRLRDRGDGALFTRYTDHRDGGRGAYRFGEGAVLAMNQLLFLSGHCLPTLVSGQEFGAVNRSSLATRISTFANGRRVHRPGGAVTLQDGIEFEGNLFAEGVRKRKGWYAFYRELMVLRRSAPELTCGEFALIEAGEKSPESQRTVVAFERRHADQIVRCAVNIGSAPRELAHADLFQRRPLYGGLINGALAPFTSIVVRST